MSSAPVTSDAQTYISSVKVMTEGPEHEKILITDATSSPLSSVPSSPPPPPDMAADENVFDSSEAMPPPDRPLSRGPSRPGRKRSNDEMLDDTQSVEHLQPVDRDIAQLAQQGKNEFQDIDSSAAMMPDSQTQGRSQIDHRGEGPLTSSAAHSQKAPPSAQGHKPKLKAPKAARAGTKKGKKTSQAPAEHELADDEIIDDSSTATDSSDDVGDPQDPIQDFDWASLADRYHQRMGECQHNEEVVLQEFGHLIEASIVEFCHRASR